jgi:hypothetical protein
VDEFRSTRTGFCIDFGRNDAEAKCPEMGLGSHGNLGVQPGMATQDTRTLRCDDIFIPTLKYTRVIGESTPDRRRWLCLKGRILFWGCDLAPGECEISGKERIGPRMNTD